MLLLGVIIGTIFAASLKTKSLILFFSIIILFLGIYLLLLKEKEQNIIIEMKLTFKNNFRFNCWIYFSCYGNWWSYNECSNFKIFWLFNK